jgi:hypothetical protein
MIYILQLLLFVPIASAQLWQTMTYRADAPGIDENPLRGLVPYSFQPQRPDSFPHSLEWFYLPLSDVVTGPDQYNWTPVEAELAKIADRGHQAVFRFYLDFPQKPSGIPPYLITQGLRTFPYTDEGNQTVGIPSVAPDYSDPRLILCLIHFIQALGSHYDGDPRIAYLTAGLYGFWGEWHVLGHPLPGEDPGWAISQSDKDTLLETYHWSFSKTPILIRYATVTADQDLRKSFGFHDDSFLVDTLGTDPWDFWHPIQDAKLGDIWQTHPIGGEIYPQLQPTVWDSVPNPKGEDFTQDLQATHMTWLMDFALFNTMPTSEQRQNALHAQRQMGYTFVCDAYSFVTDPDGSLTLNLKVENIGVAPIYYNWPVQAEWINRRKKPLGQITAQWPLATLLPGQTTEWRIPLGAVPRKSTNLLIRIANPIPKGHPVVFANAESGTLIPGWLTLPKPTSDQKRH